MIPESWKKMRKDPRAEMTLWVRYVIRPISLPISHLFLHLGASPNIMSLVTIGLAGLAFTVAVLKPTADGLLISGAIFNLAVIGDCIDGNIARARKTGSAFGEWIDALSGYFIYAFCFLALGFAAEYIASSFRPLPAGSYTFIGGVTATAAILNRASYLKFKLMGLGAETVGDQVGDVQGSFVRKIELYLGYSGFLMPGVMLAALLKIHVQFLLFYCVLQTSGLAFSIYRLWNSGTHLQEANKK